MGNKITEMFPPYPSPFKTSDGIEFVPVVRCKDCVFCWKYNDKYYLPKRDTLLCINDDTEVEPNDFCAWAERREDEAD